MGRWGWLIVGWFAAWSAGVLAQGIEGVVMPGKLIQGHAKLEEKCENCHVRFDKAAQSGLCLDCHEEVAADVNRKQGYHGRIKPQPCKDCHTDHKGREARIVVLDEAAFDHRLTDYALKGKHVEVKCDACHKPGTRHRAAPIRCNDCHRDDDVHKGGLGAVCQDCHTEANWKETRFDHGKTRFKLLGKHVDVPCKDCHVQNKYKDLPMACIACHRKDDKHKALFGEKCEACHGATDWKTIAFDHERDGRWALKGKHADAKCEACHKVDPYQIKGETACIACHKKEDKHKGALGKQCAECHNERDWKETRFDHDKTKFRLLGRHVDVPCADCHADNRYKETPKNCYGCHKALDDGRPPERKGVKLVAGAKPKVGHKGRYGEKCETCHVEKAWSEIRFDHDKDTKYALKAKHREVKCDTCHTGHLYKDKLKSECYACHRDDDNKKGHQGKLGKACEACHDERSWKVQQFDHLRTRFPLTGGHVKTACDKCHTTLDFRKAPSACGACHEKEDQHKRRLGDACERCHNTRNWKVWDFNHDRQTRFVLDGAHRKLTCETCHMQPGAKVKPLPLTCDACHGSDDVHEGAFGRHCDQCHTTERFKDVIPEPARRRRAG